MAPWAGANSSTLSPTAPRKRFENRADKRLCPALLTRQTAPINPWGRLLTCGRLAIGPLTRVGYADCLENDAKEDPFVFRRLAGKIRKENWVSVLKLCPVSPGDVPPRRDAPARRSRLEARAYQPSPSPNDVI
jgi:hypothetical protein